MDIDLSIQVVHSETIAPAALLSSIKTKPHDEFAIDHLTIQLDALEAERLDTERLDTYPCFSDAKCLDSGVKVKRKASNN